MDDFVLLWRPLLIAGALFLSVAAYAQALQVGVQPPAAPDRPWLPPMPGGQIEAELAYLKAALALTPAQAPFVGSGGGCLTNADETVRRDHPF
jgi:hypothetical protein